MGSQSILIVEPVRSGRWAVVSDGSPKPLSEHETCNDATRAAQLQRADFHITQILLRDRYGRCRVIAPPGAARSGA